ncbi:MAG: RNA 2',3'-cyclic phosphodiesterase [Methyloprofundus sp.]|nr:RNA 2',3'-cyclic phosphodiesterase [Methyloprofundus sp.]
MKRLFFALWPDNATRKQIAKINQSIYSEGLRKVKPDNLHVTLVFLGNVDTELEAIIHLGMKNISVQAFSICFDQLAFWRKPRLLCLTAQQYDQQLLILVDALKKELEQYGMMMEDRAYKAHITLARKAHRLVEIEMQPITWQAQSFCLIESLSTPDGVHYQVLQRWDFK